MDTLSPERRSALMKRVRRSDTKPEVTLRKALHRVISPFLIQDEDGLPLSAFALRSRFDKARKPLV